MDIEEGRYRVENDALMLESCGRTITAREFEIADAVPELYGDWLVMKPEMTPDVHHVSVLKKN